MTMPEAVTRSIDLSPASAGDLPAIKGLLAACNLPVDGVGDLVDSFVVARADGGIVGAGAVEPCGSYGLLRSVAVDQSMRSRGVGRALVERLVAEGEAKGYRALYLLTTTAENYFPAFGFATTNRESTPAEIRETSEFKDICPSSAIVMRRSL